jgi:hypothetical protein
MNHPKCQRRRQLLGREDCRIDGLKKKKSQKNPPENNFRRKKEKKSGSIFRVKNVAEEYRVRPPDDDYCQLVDSLSVPIYRHPPREGEDCAGQYLLLRFIGDVLIELRNQHISAYCRSVDFAREISKANHS